MHVLNVHERELDAPPARAGRLLDSLATRDDQLWPHDRWPRMTLDRLLAEGAAGGHGPVRYFVERYEPGSRVRFRFTAPRGFEGTHEFVVEARPGPDGGVDEGGRSVLRHVLEMEARGPARLTWPLVFRPLHDALIEDALDRAERSLGAQVPELRRWSPCVRGLRALLRRAPLRSLPLNPPAASAPPSRTHPPSD